MHRRILSCGLPWYGTLVAFVFPVLCAGIFSACAPAPGMSGAGLPPGDDTGRAASVARLEETVRTSPDPAARADAALRLAKWHASHRNPERNYQQALQELELYVSLTPANDVPENVRDWIAMLREYDHAAEEIRKLKQRSNQLAKENKELKDSLEKLKDLDIRMEEKRRQVK